MTVQDINIALDNLRDACRLLREMKESSGFNCGSYTVPILEHINAAKELIFKE